MKLFISLAFFVFISTIALANDKYLFNFGLGASIPLGTEHIKNNTDTGPLFHFGAYKYVNKRLAWGIDYDYLDFSDDSDLNDHSFTLNARYRFSPFYKRFLPFAKIGAGVALVTNMPGLSDDSLRAVTAKTGVGFDYAIDTHWALGVEVDYHYIAKKQENFTEQHILTPLLKITYAPGKGKNNFYYKNHKRKNWAESDEDNDGVLNKNDRCSKTPRDIVVNIFGCQTNEKIEFSLDVKFLKNSTKIDNNYSGDLSKLAEIMSTNKNIRVIIEGHTDSDGATSYNQKISEKRADAIKQKLIRDYGIKATRISSKGFGESQPIAENKTPEGKRLNRRVVAEIKFLN